LSEEAAEQRRLEREALPRPLCKLCLSIVPVPRWSYCSEKCKRIMDNHCRHYGPDLWRVLPLCQRCGLVKGVNQNPGYCRECLVIANKEAKRRHKLRQRMSGKDPNRKEFYRSGDKITRQGVLDRTGYRCHLCNRRVRLKGNPNHALYFQVDHIIPRSKGGTHTWDNVATCCRSCNGKKGDGAANDQLRLLTVGGL
jgi:5-methylcytosine-specific restriction endonuclease McrA